MKRSPRTNFDDRGQKWYQSPMYKEIKMDSIAEEAPYQFREEHNDSSKLIRDRFYDFYNKVTRNGSPKIDKEELTRSLTIKVEEVPESSRVSEIFDRLNSKVTQNSKGKKNWSEDETSFFLWLIINYAQVNNLDYQDISDGDWASLANMFPGKKDDQLKLRWQSMLKVNLSRAPWTQKEDEILSAIIAEKGAKKWKEIAMELNERVGYSKLFRQGKQCRERWINHLDPAINRGAWSNEEDISLLQAHLEIGKRWADIAKKLKTRTENAVKNRYNSLVKKYKLEGGGMESETMSTISSQYSGGSALEDLEKRISEIIINEKIKELSCQNTPSRITEVTEEEYLSDNDTDLQTEANTEAHMLKNQIKTESNSSTQSQGKKKTGGFNDISKSKNTLFGLVSQDTPKPFAPQHIQGSNPMYPQGISQIQGGQFFQNPYGNPQAAAMNKQPNQSGSQLFNQQQHNNLLVQNNSELLGNMNFINLMNPAYGHSSEQSPGMYAQGVYHQNPTNIQSVSAYPEPVQDEHKAQEDGILRFTEKSPNEIPNDLQNLQYSIVDVQRGFIYFVGPVTKDNFPPQFTSNHVGANQTMNTPGQPSLNRKISGSADFVMPSPGLGNMYSPGIFGNGNILNIMKNQFSPNLFHDSVFERGLFGGDKNNWSSEWTPENSARPLNLTDSTKMRSNNLLWGQNRSPDQRFSINNSALLTRGPQSSQGYLQGVAGFGYLEQQQRKGQ